MKPLSTLDFHGVSEMLPIHSANRKGKMEPTCYKHPAKAAVAKIERKVMKNTPEGSQQITIKSFVCQECADGAKAIKTPVFDLEDE